MAGSPRSASAPRPRLALPTRVALLRIAFGALWLIDAWLKWQPAFATDYLSYLTDAAKGQPAVFKPWFDVWINLVTPDPRAWAYLTALVETLIALGLLFGVGRRLVYVLGVVFAVLVWSTAEGFGGPYTAGATDVPDVGAAVIYVFVFAGLYGLDELAGRAALSLDPWLERRVSRWRLIAGPGGGVAPG